MPRKRTTLAVVVALASALLLATAGSASAAPTASISDVTVTEGTGSTVQAVFTITLSEPSLTSVSVDAVTAPGTATGGIDFGNRATSTVTFSPGQTSKTYNVAIVGDTLDEYDEQFYVNLSNPSFNLTIADGQGVGTIVDDDAPPSVNVSDASVTEGDSAYVQEVFTVSLSAPSAKPITVHLSTTPNTATAADYSPRIDSVMTFPAGSTSQKFNVAVRPDTLDEFDETFYVDATQPVNVDVPSTRATDTIVDNDPPPALSISDASVTEGDSAYVQDVTNLTLSAVSAKPISVHLTTTPNTATTADYSPRIDSVVSFPPGSTSQKFNVAVRPDLMDEYDETFYVDATQPDGATLASTRATDTILDNDDPPTLSIADTTVAEPELGSVVAKPVISLSQKSAKPISVTRDTYDGTATDAFDYVPVTANTINIPANTGSVTAPVTVLSDDEREPDETFGQTLSAPQNASVADGDGTVTISANCWDREPSTQAGALYLGSIAGNIGTGELIGPPFSAICTNDTDWYRFQLRDDQPDPCPPDPDPNGFPCDPPPPSDGPLSATVGLNVADGGLSSNLDLYVYDQTGAPVGLSTNPGTMDESVTFQVPNLPSIDDTQDFYVQVVGVPDPTFGAASNDYALTVDGHTQP